MKTASNFILLLLPLVLVSQQSTIEPGKYEYNPCVYEMESGLTVILTPDSSIKNVSSEIWIKEGYSSEESRQQYGSMHFFEHVTPWEKGASDLFEKWDDYINDSNAQVKEDFTRYYLRSKPEGLETIVRLVHGRLTAGSKNISHKVIERERGRVFKEIERQTKNPRWSATGGMIIATGTFGDKHPYGHVGYGLIENNEAFTLEEMQQIYVEKMHPKNCIFL